MAFNTPNPNVPIPPETAPMAADSAKADSTDRSSKSLVKNLNPGALKPANVR